MYGCIYLGGIYWSTTKRCTV